MGYNTNLTICNDNLAEYERHPEMFLRIVSGALLEGDKTWGITVHSSENADATQLIAVGGNFSTRVLSAGYGLPSHHTPDGQHAILKAWANRLGYRLEKK